MVDPIYAILGMTIIAAGNSVLKKLSSPGETDKERTEKMMKDRMNDFFKTVKLCNKKEEPEYAYVKWASDYESYTIIGVSLPSGCDINALLKLESALENEFQNDVEILYDNQNYRVKIFKGHLGKPNSYPFEVVPVPDTNHLYITTGMSLDGPVTINLTKTLPNILGAGTSGSGKSVLVKSILCQLIENYTPDQLKVIYLDNKGGVEANTFKNIKHLAAISSNVEGTIVELMKIKKEMFRRLELIKNKDATGIVEYNKKVTPREKLPFIFVVIDELFSFATLPASPPNRKEMDPGDAIFNQKTAYRTMAEIASMCRAVGIHLMFCTQRPTSDVIPTLITCNCGIRIGLRTSNEQESRNIIENKGLEIIDLKAVGQGIVKTDKLTRFQTFWTTDDKIKAICSKHKKAQVIIPKTKTKQAEVHKNQSSDVAF